VSDYDFQTALMEALCRMATPAQRREVVHRWFTVDYVAKAFITIRDSEFETVQSHAVPVRNITPHLLCFYPPPLTFYASIVFFS